MAKKPSITTVASGYQSTTTINNNTQNLRDAFDNTLSLDGSTPNAMLADLDMNSNDIINVDKLYLSGLYIDGQPVAPGTLNYNGVIKETQTATSGQTVFNLTTMVYNPGINSLSVYVDGVYQNPSTYTENNSTRITFSAGLHVGAIVDFVALSINEITGAADASSVTYSPTAQSLYGTSTITVKSALDQISNQGTGSSKVGFLQSGTGATNRTVQEKLRDIVSAKDFGAVGNGVADDTAALQAFINACQDKRGYIPPGIYKITAPLIVQPQYSYNIEGACYDNTGATGTVINNTGTGNAIEIDNEPFTPPPFDSEIRFAHLVVNGNASSQNGFFIRSTMVHLEYVWCRGHGTNGIWLERGYASSFRQVVCANNNENGMFVRIAGNALHFDHCVFNGNGRTISGSAGLYLTGQDPDGYDFGVVATACDFTGNGTLVAIGYGVIAQYCRGISFIGCYGELNKSYNLYTDTTTKNLTVTGCYWQDGDVYAVDVNGLIYENNHHNRTSTATNVRISVGLPGGKYENRIFGNTYNNGAVEVFTNGASSNVAIHYTQPPTGGTWKRGDTVWNNSVQNGGGLLGWVCITPGTPGTWLQIGQIPYVFTNWGDSDATLTVGASFTTNIWQSALTVNRTVTLSSTGAYSGAKFRITRAAGATGVSTLDVGGLKSLAVSQWCDVEYTGANWIVTAFGSL